MSDNSSRTPADHSAAATGEPASPAGVGLDPSAPSAAHPDLPGYTYLHADVYASREPRPRAPAEPERPGAARAGRRRVAVLAAVAVAVVVGLVVVGVAVREGPGGAHSDPTRPVGALADVVADPGVVATATVQAADTVEVVEVVSWPDGGPADIRLTTPDLTTLPGVPPAFEPRVTQLEVTLDGMVAPAIADGADGTGWTVSYSAEAPSTMVVRYVVSGAIVRSAPSESGRALLLVAPLSAPAAASLPVRVQLPQDGVLGVGCPGATTPVDQLCGRQQASGWTAEPPLGSLAVVVVQLDLPPL